MLYSHDRNQLRNVFINAWDKRNSPKTLEPLEQNIINTIAEHPEYHRFFENGEANIDQDFSPEMGQVNPYLHISMHMAIREQLSINQPKDVSNYYQKLLLKIKDSHEVEHVMMECLSEMIWRAQRENSAPSEKEYLNCLQSQTTK